MPKVRHLFRATWWLFLAFGRAWWYARSQLAQALHLPEKIAVDKQEIRRQRHYFYGSSYLAAVMGILRNQSRSRRETYLFSNLSALAFYFDDLVDAVREDEDIFFWQDNPEAYGEALDKRGLALHLLHNIYRELPERNQTMFRAYLHRVFNLETAGRQRVGRSLSVEVFPPTGSCQAGEQLGAYLDIEILEKITAEKGGASVLLFRRLLSHDLSKMEENALYHFGYLIQYSDDIFDLWHDHQAGIVTLATYLAELGEMEHLKKMYEEQVSATNLAFRHTTYPSIQVETALYSLHYLVSITRICLQHYLDVARKYGNLPLHDRTIMVVDMEKFNNRLRVVRYLFRPLS